MKISDVIENFIIEVMGDDKCAEISRNELASYFQCAPSQINYVLKTRFTTERGFNVVGQRGGGGWMFTECFQKAGGPAKLFQRLPRLLIVRTGGRDGRPAEIRKRME